MAYVDAQSVFIVVLSSLAFPVVGAFVFTARVPVLVVVGIALVGVVVLSD